MRKFLRHKIKSGASLSEVLVATAIVAMAAVTMIKLFLYCVDHSDLARNMTRAVTDAQSKMEEIKDHTYSLIPTDYAAGGTPGNIFTTTNGMGVIYIDSTNPDLLQIKAAVCWQNRNGRIMGEDTNLNGTLEAGEDLNNNAEIDSPATLISLMAKR